MNDPLDHIGEPKRMDDVTAQLLKLAEHDRNQTRLSDDLPVLRHRVQRRRVLGNAALLGTVLAVIVAVLVTLGNIPRWTDKPTALRVDTIAPVTNEAVNCKSDLSEILVEPTVIEGFALNDFTVHEDGSLGAVLRGENATSSLPGMVGVGEDLSYDESAPWIDADLTSLQGIWYPVSPDAAKSPVVDQPVQWLSGHLNQFVQSIVTVDLWPVAGDGSKSFERCVTQLERDNGYVAAKPPPGPGRYLVVGYLQAEVVRPVTQQRSTVVFYAGDTALVDVAADGSFHVIERPRRSPHVIEHHRDR